LVKKIISKFGLNTTISGNDILYLDKKIIGTSFIINKGIVNWSLSFVVDTTNALDYSKLYSKNFEKTTFENRVLGLNQILNRIVSKDEFYQKIKEAYEEIFTEKTNEIEDVSLLTNPLFLEIKTKQENLEWIKFGGTTNGN